MFTAATKKNLNLFPQNIWDQFTYNVVTIIKLFWLALSHNIFLFLLSSLETRVSNFLIILPRKYFHVLPSHSRTQTISNRLSFPSSALKKSLSPAKNEWKCALCRRPLTLHNIFVFNKQISFSLRFIVRRCGLKISLCP